MYGLIRLGHIAILVTAVHIARVYTHRSDNYVMDTTSPATACSGAEVAFMHTGISSISCSAICSSDPDCTGVLHTVATGTCVGCRSNVIGPMTSETQSDTDTKFYNKGCKRANTWCYFGGSSYLLNQSNLTYAEAKTYCENEGATLVEVSSMMEQEYLGSILSNAAVALAYIGLELNVTTDGWTWVNGGASYLRYWDNGEPDNVYGWEGCAVIWRAHKWADVNCEERFPFLCEK